MKVDVSKSVYHENPEARGEFSREEWRRMRLLLRRLRFLEASIEENGGLGNSNANGGAAFAEWEADALEWILTEVGFLAERTEPVRV